MVTTTYCQLCGCPFGMQFTKEVFIVGGKKLCESCWWDLFLNKPDTYCAHCHIFFKQDSKSIKIGGLWYCEICAQEMEERSKPSGPPVSEIFQRYEKIRRDTYSKLDRKQVQ